MGQVTISVERYEELRNFENAANENSVIFQTCGYGGDYYKFMNATEVLKKAEGSNSLLLDTIEERDRTISELKAHKKHWYQFWK
jgi:hypothetical protein